MKIEADGAALQGREFDEAAAVASGAYCWVTHTLQFSRNGGKWLMAKETLAAFKVCIVPCAKEEWDDQHCQDYAEEVPCFSTDEAAVYNVFLQQQGRQIERKNMPAGVAVKLAWKQKRLLLLGRKR